MQSALALRAVGVLVACCSPWMPAAAAASPPSTTPELLDEAVDAHRIDRPRADVYLAAAFGAPDRVPARYRSRAPWDGTVPLLELRRRLRAARPSRLRSAARELVAASTGSTCSGSTSALPDSLQSAHFYVQYDAATVGTGLAIGDYVASLEGAWDKEVSQFGWAPPPVKPSSPPPGNTYHVRIDTLSGGLYGYVSSAGSHAGLVGDNPATPWNEGDAYASCMVLNRDYTGFYTPPHAALDSTTAHEFNHSLQFGYGGLDGPNAPDDDFVEGGASWMEDEVYDNANDNYGYLWPDFSLSMGSYDDGWPYPYWLVLRGLTERYGSGVARGSEQVMQDFWEGISKGTGELPAMQAAFAHKGTTLGAAFHAYAIAARFERPCSNAYSYPYCLEEGPAMVSDAGAPGPVT